MKTIILTIAAALIAISLNAQTTLEKSTVYVNRLAEALNLTGAKIMVSELKDSQLRSKGNYEIDAYVMQWQKGVSEYVIYYNPAKAKFTRAFIELLIHELSHIRQYEDGRLEPIDAHTFNWEGKLYDARLAKNADYYFWPNEADARNNTIAFKKAHKELVKELVNLY